MNIEIRRLEVKLKKVQTGRDKLNILKKLIIQYEEISNPECIKYGKQALIISRELKDNKEIAESSYRIALGEHKQNNFQEALDFYEKALKIKTRLKDKKGIAIILNNMGLIYHKFCEYEKSFKFHNDALQIREEIFDQEGIANSLNNLGLVFWKLEKYDEALENYFSSIKIWEKIKDENGILRAFSNIGTIYYEQGDKQKSLKYNLKTLEIEKRIDNKKAMSITFNNLGILFNDFKDYKKAYNYFFQALQLYKEFDQKSQMANTFNNIGKLFIESGEYEKALDYLEKGLNLSSDISAKDLIRQNYLHYYELYSVQDDHKNALKYYKLFTGIKDEIFNETNNRIIAEMNSKFQIEKQEKETEILRHKNKELAELNKKIRKQKKALEKTYSELFKFSYISSHDLRSPLRAIHTLVDWLITDYSDKFDKQGKENLQLILNRVKRMNLMLDSIKTYFKIGQRDIPTQEIDLNLLIKKIIRKLKPAKSLKILIEKELPTLNIEKFYLELVFQNLLDNAVKFINRPDGVIRIGYSKTARNLKFYVEDNGIGIDKKYFTKIFQIFQTLHSRDEIEGIGIGLSITKKIISFYEGKIWIESELQKGTKINFTIPRKRCKLPDDR